MLGEVVSPKEMGFQRRACCAWENDERSHVSTVAGLSKGRST